MIDFAIPTTDDGRFDIPSDYWNRGARHVFEATVRIRELGIQPGDALFVRFDCAAKPGNVVITGAGRIQRLRHVEPVDLEILGVVLGRSGEVHDDDDEESDPPPSA